MRRVLASHANLPALLRAIDQLRGPPREEELERVLGVAPTQAAGFAMNGLSASSSYSSNTYAGNRRARTDGWGRPEVTEEDMKALRELAEAIESAVRGEQNDVLGLDWEATVE